MEKQVFPKFDLFPRLSRAGHFIKRLAHQLPETPLAPSEFPKHPERLQPKLKFRR